MASNPQGASTPGTNSVLSQWRSLQQQSQYFAENLNAVFENYAKVLVALDSIVLETMDNPPARPYSADSYLPPHLLKAAQSALFNAKADWGSASPAAPDAAEPAPAPLYGNPQVVTLAVTATSVKLSIFGASGQPLVRELRACADGHLLGTRPGSLRDDLPNSPLLPSLENLLDHSFEVWARLSEPDSEHAVLPPARPAPEEAAFQQSQILSLLMLALSVLSQEDANDQDRLECAGHIEAGIRELFGDLLLMNGGASHVV